MANNNFATIAIVGAIVLLALGVIELPKFGGSGSDTDGLFPSDLKTTVTLNTGDALATTATDATVNWYIFKSTGEFLKEGTTSSGTSSFTVPTNGQYKAIIFYDESGTDFLPIQIDFSTNGADISGRADKTVNVDLMRESAATINAVQDPVDLNANVSASAGATANFDILISATTSNAALNKPVVRLEYNSTNIDLTNCPALSEVDCPDRLAPDASENDQCFELDRVLKSSDGIATISCNMLFDASNGAASDGVEITVMDTGIYLESNYKTKGITAFKFGTENPIGNSIIGAADSSATTLGVQG